MNAGMPFKGRSTGVLPMDPGININIVPAENDLVIFPFVKMHQVIFAHDQGKFSFRELLFEYSQRIHCIIWLRQVEFNITGFERRIGLCGPVHQFKTMPVIQ